MNVTLEELKVEVLQNPEVRAEYERLRPEFELAETIIAARTAQGLTQAELAARMKTSQSYIARLESGRVLPSMRTWQRLAAATGTRPRVTLEPLTPELSRCAAAHTNPDQATKRSRLE